MNETIRIEEDTSHLALAGAKLIAEKIQTTLQKKNRFSLVLAGGKTPVALYQCLSQTHIPWMNIDLFWSDERHVSPTHPDSNYLMAKKNLLSKISIPPENIYRIKSELANAEAAANDYEKVIKKYFLNRASHSDTGFDLVLLGMGVEGHTASLFPETPICDHWVCAPWVKKLNAHRITLTPDLLNRAADIIIMIEGKEKAKVVSEVLSKK